MITVLTMEEHTPKTAFEKIGNKFKRDYIKNDIKSIERLKVSNIIYNKYKEKVLWDKIGRQAGYEKKALLCSQDIELPKHLGFKRYNSKKLNERMSENAAFEALERLKLPRGTLKIGVYDPKGTRSDIVEALLKYTAMLTVVTDDIQYYLTVLDDIMDRCGASFIVQKNLNYLAECTVVVAPEKILRRIPLKSSAIVFTGHRPAVGLQGLVFDDFTICLPSQYKELKPSSISDEYFAGALYDRGKQYRLGAAVPDICRGNGCGCTIDELCTILSVRCKNT